MPTFCGIALLLLASASAFGTHPTAPSGPDVLFILVDDLNGFVSPLGGIARTPNIDRLARRGVVFTKAYAASASCTPSRAAIFTGLHALESQFYSNISSWELSRRDRSLPHTFQNAGYSVVSVGKTVPSNSDVWDESFEVPNEPFFQQDHFFDLSFGPLDVNTEDMADHMNVSWAIQRLKRDAEPLFLVAGIGNPHLPWQVPSVYFDEVASVPIELPSSTDVDDLPWESATPIAGLDFRARFRDPIEHTAAIRAYLAAVAFADDQIGRLLDALEASPRADQTIIVLASDNGMMLGEKGQWKKWTLWREACHVPLIIALPNGYTDRIDYPVSISDVFATLVELCGIDEGRDAPGGFSLFSGSPRPAVTAQSSGEFAIRTESFTLLQYPGGNRELYAPEDPGEIENLFHRNVPELARKPSWLPWMTGAVSRRVDSQTPPVH